VRTSPGSIADRPLSASEKTGKSPYLATQRIVFHLHGRQPAKKLDIASNSAFP
jgi:hypothetical protein